MTSTLLTVEGYLWPSLSCEGSVCTLQCGALPCSWTSRVQAGYRVGSESEVTLGWLRDALGFGSPVSWTEQEIRRSQGPVSTGTGPWGVL